MRSITVHLLPGYQSRLEAENYWRKFPITVDFYKDTFHIKISKHLLYEWFLWVKLTCNHLTISVPYRLNLRRIQGQFVGNSVEKWGHLGTRGFVRKRRLGKEQVIQTNWWERESGKVLVIIAASKEISSYSKKETVCPGTNSASCHIGRCSGT